LLWILIETAILLFRETILLHPRASPSKEACMKQFTLTPPKSGRVVVSRGKFRFFLSLFLIPLYFGACPNPSNSEPSNSNPASGPGPEPSAYTVSFKGNYGANETLYIRVTIPATVIPSADFPANPSRSGYAFAGWNTKADGSGSAFTPETTVNANITVYAQWTESSAPPDGPPDEPEPYSYTVTFLMNDGTGNNYTVKTVTAPAVTVTDFPGNPSRNGYIFAGWNTRADGSGSVFTASTAVSGNMTVHAKWTEVRDGSYTVTFRVNDGTDAVWTVKTVTAPVTAIDTLPAPPARMGYSFGGWYTGADGSGSVFTVPATVSDDITIYAQWTANTYTVTFKSNYGANAALYTRRVAVPALSIPPANFPADPSWTGYAFAGWNTAADGSGSAFTVGLRLGPI
jgi:uncharacterized repeat protein (TIGR02543 family)